MNSGTNAFLEGLRLVAPDFLPGWMLMLTAAVVGVAVVLGIVSVIAMASVWMERKVSGHIQCRFGPMYVGGWHGWAQSIADGVKLMTKEDIIPSGGDKVLFVLAPALLLGAILGAMALCGVFTRAGEGLGLDAWEWVICGVVAPATIATACMTAPAKTAFQWLCEPKLQVWKEE